MALKKKLQDWFADGYHGIPRAGEYQQNNEYLSGILYLPTIAKALNPIHGVLGLRGCCPNLLFSIKRPPPTLVGGNRFHRDGNLLNRVDKRKSARMQAYALRIGDGR